jgi:rhodanese-related sulfurtransferase
MKKVFLILFMALFLLTGCGNNDISDNIVFNATIESIQDNSMVVTTTDDVGFDKARVGFAENLETPFDLAAGQTIEIEALPQIRESYPVQITAVKISLIEEPKEEPRKNSYTKLSPQEAQEMMNEDVIILDVRTPAEFAEGINRSSIYRDPPKEKIISDEDLFIMRRIDEIHTAHPTWGYRTITKIIRRDDEILVNRKKIRRMMRVMGIYTIYPKPNLSKRYHAH